MMSSHHFECVKFAYLRLLEREIELFVSPFTCSVGLACRRHIQITDAVKHFYTVESWFRLKQWTLTQTAPQISK